MKSLYEKTIAFVLQYIDEQKLREGDQLPTEAQISSLAGVSLVTVRRALSELAAQGGGSPGAGARNLRCASACRRRDHQNRQSAQWAASGCPLKVADAHIGLRRARRAAPWRPSD